MNANNFLQTSCQKGECDHTYFDLTINGTRARDPITSIESFLNDEFRFDRSIPLIPFEKSAKTMFVDGIDLSDPETDILYPPINRQYLIYGFYGIYEKTDRFQITDDTDDTDDTGFHTFKFLYFDSTGNIVSQVCFTPHEMWELYTWKSKIRYHNIDGESGRARIKESSIGPDISKSKQDCTFQASLKITTLEL